MPNFVNIVLICILLFFTYHAARSGYEDARSRNDAGVIASAVLIVIYLLAAYQLLTLYRLGGA